MRSAVLSTFLALLAMPALAGEFTVETRRIEDAKSVFATVESVDEILARARIGGTVSGLLVDEGSQVSAGQRIATIGDPKLGLQGAGIEARLKSLEAERDLAAIELKRAEELLAKGAATKARVDDSRTKLEVASRSISAMRSEKLVLAERTSEGAVLAPASGRVLDVKVTEGSVVMPGETIAIIASETFVLRLLLPERHARFIKVGDGVAVGARELATGGEPAREGRVRQVYPRIKDGRVAADVAVEGLGDFFVGERVAVRIATGARDALIVPREAVSRRFGLDIVRLKDGPEAAVQLGAVTPDGVEVLGGVKSGDVVVW